ncbi:hypothetical protein J0J29_23570, partial [Vibrio vulnificus]|uniref:hypothetical protein n=1 Tax=Vibrio vulnificus TaxID=672 RepID=UPI0019D41AF1
RACCEQFRNRQKGFLDCNNHRLFGKMRVSVVILVVILAFVAKRVFDYNGLRTVHPVNQFASCEKIFGAGTVGAEDIAVHPVTGIAYI